MADDLAPARRALKSADAYAERTWGKLKPAPPARTTAKRAPARRAATISQRDVAWGQPQSIGDNIDIRNQLLGNGARKKKRATGRSSNGR